MRRTVLLGCLALFLAVAPLLAGTFSGKIESVDVDGRSVVIEGPKSVGSKTFTISEKATITIAGKKGDLQGLAEGATITVTYDKDDNVTKIIAKAATGTKKPTAKTAAAKPDAKADTVRETGGSTADWPCFDGPERTNVSKEAGLLKSWPEGGPKIAWRAEGLGQGYASVSVANGYVYTYGNVGTSETVTAMHVDSGKIAWQQKTGAASKLSAGDGPRGTPTVDGDLVYTLGGTGDLSCMQAKTGKPVWQINLLKEYNGNNPAWGMCESVLIDGEKLICTPGGRDGTMVALNKKTGKQIWRCVAPGTPQAGYSSPIIAEVGGVRQYIQFTHNNLLAARAEDGTYLWSNDSAANGTANCSSPLFDQDMVFAASGYGKGGAMVELSSGGGKTQAKFGYHTKDMQSHHGGMILVDGKIYGSSDPGVLRCIDLKSGDVKWEDRSVGKGALTAADGHIYLRSEQGPVALVELTPEGYREKGRFDQPNRSGASSWAHPVVSNGKLFLRDQNLLLAYDIKE